MRGRRPSGPEYVDKLSGSTAAKARLRIVLETVAGTRRVSEACALLGVSEQRFEQLRIEALQAGLARLEPQPKGRPPRQWTPADLEVEQLRHRVTELEAELRLAAVRTEVAAILPSIADPEKKTPPP
jgi:Helix-turn-helix domain